MQNESGCSVNDHALGALYKGDTVKVLGMVTKNGEDYKWYQIEYNQAQAYVSAGLLAPNPPTSSSASSQTSEEGRGDVVDDPASQGFAYCEYCGQWYEEGNILRNHVCPARDAAYAE